MSNPIVINPAEVVALGKRHQCCGEVIRPWPHERCMCVQPAKPVRADRCYGGRNGWQTCTECNGRIHAVDCTSPKRAGVDCPGCLPPKSEARLKPVSVTRPKCDCGGFAILDGQCADCSKLFKGGLYMPCRMCGIPIPEAGENPEPAALLCDDCYERVP